MISVNPKHKSTLVMTVPDGEGGWKKVKSAWMTAYYVDPLGLFPFTGEDEQVGWTFLEFKQQVEYSYQPGFEQFSTSRVLQRIPTGGKYTLEKIVSEAEEPTWERPTYPHKTIFRYKDLAIMILREVSDD